MLEAQQFTGIEWLDTGELRLEFEATPGPVWVVEASPDLNHWTAIDTNTRLFEFVDPQPSQFPERFYRARQP